MKIWKHLQKRIVGPPKKNEDMFARIQQSYCYSKVEIDKTKRDTKSYL